jgi:4-hydroxy-3-polyprenylbenzoate decarboxylase
MGYTDLRDWIEQVEAMGELRHISGADWQHEVSAVADISSYPVLFDQIQGYPPGYRILANPFKSLRAWLLTVGLSTEARGKILNREWRERLKRVKPLPPKVVESGPVMENVRTGNDVDVPQFPAPLWHEHDGGRYIGTADAVVMRDPEEGWINLGNYRLQVHDNRTLGLYICYGKHGDSILEKYRNRSEPSPVVVLLGEDPSVLMASILHVPWGLSEYDFAGGLKGTPLEVVTGPLTGLPIPAASEIAIEGEVPPNEFLMEGPFGEWTGYSEPRLAPIIRVKAIYHRHNPILLGLLPRQLSRPTQAKLQGDFCFGGMIWDEIEKAGARDVQAVATYSRFLIVVSIKQRYAGQARQTGLLASQCHSGGFMGRYVVVVDEDVNPFNLDEVVWAILFRSDPQRAIEIIRYCWTDQMDSIHFAGRPEAEKGYNSRCIIDACTPVEWKKRAKVPVEISDEMRQRILEKWGDSISPSPFVGSFGR